MHPNICNDAYALGVMNFSQNGPIDDHDDSNIKRDGRADRLTVKEFPKFTRRR